MARPRLVTVTLFSRYWKIVRFSVLCNLVSYAVISSLLGTFYPYRCNGFPVNQLSFCDVPTMC